MKKNNKGFSLVELIVVVLIMGIIAVALAPQVIKWVENSRRASDASAYDELYEEIQVALVNKAAIEAVSANKYEFTIDDTGVTFTIGGGDPQTIVAMTATPAANEMRPNGYIDSSTTNPVIASLYTVDPDWYTFKKKASDTATLTAYVITADTDLTVDRTTTPDPETDY